MSNSPLVVLSSLSLISVLAAATAEAGLRVDFDQSAYTVSPGETFVVQISLDADEASPGSDPLADGLFSYGVKLSFADSDAEASDESAIVVPSELEFSGFSSPALRSVSSGLAAVKGNIDLGLFVPYAGTLLATITIANLAPPSTSYALNLDFYRTLGPSEDLFLDGLGAVLDPDITFGSAIVTVRSESLPALTWEGRTLFAALVAFAGTAMLRFRPM